MSYFSGIHGASRKVIGILLEDMRPEAMTPDEYAKALTHFHDEDFRAPTDVFATCPTCWGDGMEKNPAWYDDDECREPEALDCSSCRGVGFVRLVEPPPAAFKATPLDDDLPF